MRVETIEGVSLLGKVRALDLDDLRSIFDIDPRDFVTGRHPLVAAGASAASDFAEPLRQPVELETNCRTLLVV